MPSASLELAERLDLLLAPAAGRPAPLGAVRGGCRICGATVRAPRYRYCGAECYRVVYGAASERTLLMRVERERMLLREQASAHVTQAKAAESTALDDGAPRVPADIAARRWFLEQWAAKLRGAA